MLFRNFIPIGQGAFYLEQFFISGKTINVIYDCGSDTDISILKKEINSNLRKEDEIFLLFISHFHSDHITGLEYLLKNYKIKNIIAPYTSKKDKYLESLIYLCSSSAHTKDDFIYRFINDPNEAILETSESNSYSINIFSVLPYGEEQSDITNDKTKLISSGNNILEKNIIPDEYLSSYAWEYVPFCFKNKERSNTFYDQLQINLSVCSSKYISMSLEELVKNWENKEVQNAVKEAYKKVSSDLNLTSLTLFSGAKNDIIKQTLISDTSHKGCVCIKEPCDCFYECDYNTKSAIYCRALNNIHKDRVCINKPCGCLYTGDYNAKGPTYWNSLEIAYKDYINYIGCIQIPHHGSNYNYNSEFAKFNAFYIISAGIHNKHRHPSRYVINHLLSQGHNPIIVTEKHNSHVTLLINI